MNDIQILKEITFYSKLINQQKKQILKQNNRNKYVVTPQTAYNKYKYVKKESAAVITSVNMESAVVTAVPKTLVHKVLINPNFKQTVLINPHFHIQNRKIHVNPKIINTQLPPKEPPRTLPQSFENIPKINEQSNSKLSSRKRRVSIRSKYKIVKSSCLNSPTKSLNSVKYLGDKYKIDRRVNNINKTIIKKKVVRHGISDMLRHNVLKNKTWKNSLLLNHFKSHNTRLTNISGILYKKSQTKLQKVQPSSNNIPRRKSSVFSIALNKKSLKRVSSAAKINKTFKKTNKLKYKSNNLSLNNIRKLKQKSAFQARNKLRKNNQPCPVYRRYGKCRRKEAGRCHFIHNPNQIFLCKKFLQGACIDKDCLLSHKVSLEKMPTCKYFLEGCCVRNDCQYLHVKINPKADICRKFLEGFCAKGSQCNLRHQFLCPIFEKNGKCPKRKCMFPHKIKADNVDKVKIHPKKETIEDEKSSEPARYYIDTSATYDDQVNNDNETNSLSSRPRLGSLPSFIPFN